MARKTPDPKAKAKRQKIILAVGGVILLGLLAFQLPKLMKGSPAPATTAVTTTAGTGSTPATTGAVSAPSSTPVSAELTFSTSVEKLGSLSAFRTRDPFKPLVSSSTAADTPAVPTPPAAPPAADVTAPPETSVDKGPLFGTVDGSKAAGSLPTATIVFNGTHLQLKLGQSFPKSKPVFRLAGIQSASILIAPLKGGLADGSDAITLRNGHPVTLVNTANGARYTLVLRSGKKGS
jgi:hypothetical protein